MKLSILDQSPTVLGKTEQDALQESVHLARLGEKLGYHRYWIAEHHDLKGLACPAPEVMLGIIGSQTESIRIGAGAILLPHYKPYKVAETFNLLATLYPNRIDLGLGRSPGGSAEASLALSENFLENVRKMPADIDELLNFLYLTFPDDHMFSKVKPTPVPETPPETWLLGTSEKSAILAGEKGMRYTFGHFMSDVNGPEIVSTYRKKLKENRQDTTNDVIVAVSAFCAETDEEANDLAMSHFVASVKRGKGEKIQLLSPSELTEIQLTDEEKEEIEAMKKKQIIGSPGVVKAKLKQLQKEYDTDEFMILTNTYNYETRRKSYELIASELL
ncbi:luciferase family oxidoreductase, group 1 [Ornithinibacillus halophilus]|uniref:Luciferase family oxidoreductase, group 1 n=1 Tax=Ornithinibacillus halophilus TaxID=930117 RepID=A0A1M5F5K3_9BACI|nr:luciferase family oxidoreductase, group 1 [Ornithinibacillus halophilus]